MNLAVIGVVAVLLVAFRLRLGLILAACFALGFWRGEAALPAHSPLGRLEKQPITAAGIITDDPGITNKGQATFVMRVERLNGRPVHDTLRVYAVSYMELQRGNLVEVSGKPWPARGIVSYQVSFAPVVVVSTQQSWLERLRQRFFAAMHQVLPDPLSGFGLGLLVGARALIGKSLQDTLVVVGLSHLTAVSGYNLTIIVQAVRRGLGRASLFVTTSLSLWLIAVFLLIAGFSASIVRAALVSVLALGTRYYGYEIKPMTLIMAPALIMILRNPNYLLHDLGFQLSFLAFAGILILAPLIQQRWVRRPNTIKLLVIESLAAQLMTTPLILAVFANLSLIAPLSNIVIVPLIPLAMALSGLSGAVGMLAPGLAGWAALPAAGVLALIVGLIQWFAGWPHASTEVYLGAPSVIGLYLLFAAITIILWRRNRTLELSDRHVL